jgi:hypothetical protein
MCMFSGPVEDVSDTKIFARLDGKGNQYIVYSMQFEAAQPVAMILPIPVSSHAEDAVRFIDLSGYPTLFEDMFEAFAVQTLSLSGDTLCDQEDTLTVHNVGDFVASFVPTVSAMNRLDVQFRLPHEIWDNLPTYSHYGFCVFQFDRNRARRRGVRKAHPMAFSFPTRDPGWLFFPTVHVHDGRVHDKEQFDHSLYFQADEVDALTERSWMPAKHFVDTSDPTGRDRTIGIVDGSEIFHRVTIAGVYQNQDTWVEVGPKPYAACS